MSRTGPRGTGPGEMKENDGRAARQSLFRRGIIFGGLFLFVGLLFIVFGGEREGIKTSVRHVTRQKNSLSKFGKSMLSVKEGGKKEEKLVLHAQFHLVELIVPGAAFSSDGSEKYGDGVKGIFCPLDWSLQKANPSTVPMFKDLLSQSKCQLRKFSFDFKSIVQKARDFDAQSRVNKGPVKSLQPTGFVFHESRCGSTLVANSLAAMDPEKNRVYSESGPPIKAIRACAGKADCDESKAASLLRDVVYLMGRTNDPMEDRLFFKIQSIGTQHISVVRKAFPETPWIFVYRDPVQTVMSHWRVPNKSTAVCMRYRKMPTAMFKEVIKGHGRSANSLSQEEFCAAHLASLCESALREHRLSGAGRMVNYAHLPDVLMDSILPDYFKVPVGDGQRTRIRDVCEKYSKGRGSKANQEWKSDSEAKEKKATTEVRAACDTFLKSRFDSLQALAATPIQKQ